MVLTIVDKHLATIGASRARGENIKIVARVYGISDVASPLFNYTRDTCKIRIDADGSFSHVLGIEIDDSRGESKVFDDQFGAVAAKAVELQERLGDLDDSPSEFTLLKNCPSACKVVHLMRAAGPYLSTETLDNFDNSVIDGVGRILGHQVDDEAKLQIGLPTNQGGLGLYRVGSMALSYLLFAVRKSLHLLLI